MSKLQSISRYNLIIQKLRKRPATLREIADYLEQQSDLKGDNFRVSPRTFQRDVKDILSIYNIDIQFDFKRKLYAIATDEQNEANEHILEAFDIFNALNVSERLSKSLLIEKRKPRGTENIHGILHAIKNKLQVSFSYLKFWEDAPTLRVVQPYALKEFKNRWYVLALDTKDNAIKTFGLDRLSDLEISRKKFIFPKDFSASDYFKNSFDIERPNDGKPEEVVLSFTQEKGKYIKTLPLHESQQVLVDNEKEFRVKLDVYVSYALKQEILSHGNEVKVLKPASLVKAMKEQLKSALEQYE